VPRRRVTEAKAATQFLIRYASANRAIRFSQGWRTVLKAHSRARRTSGSFRARASSDQFRASKPTGKASVSVTTRKKAQTSSSLRSRSSSVRSPAISQQASKISTSPASICRANAETRRRCIATYSSCVIRSVMGRTHNAGIDRARTQRINHASLADESRAIRAPVE